MRVNNIENRKAAGNGRTTAPTQRSEIARHCQARTFRQVSMPRIIPNPTPKRNRTPPKMPARASPCQPMPAPCQPFALPATNPAVNPCQPCQARASTNPEPPAVRPLDSSRTAPRTAPRTNHPRPPATTRGANHGDQWRLVGKNPLRGFPTAASGQPARPPPVPHAVRHRDPSPRRTSATQPRHATHPATATRTAPRVGRIKKRTARASPAVPDGESPRRTSPNWQCQPVPEGKEDGRRVKTRASWHYRGNGW